MGKIKPNEIIGIPFFIGMIVFLVFNLLSPCVEYFILEGFCGIMAMIFLSYWGLTTFNNYFKN